MGPPLHSQLRKVLQRFFFKIIHFFFHKEVSKEQIDPKQISSILIIRINYRIGNTLFLTPLIQALEEAMPNAKMDILVGAGFTKPLLSGFKNVETVYDFPRKLLRNPLFLIRYIRQLCSHKYDLVISPNSGSGSDRLATLLAQGRYKLGQCKTQTWTPNNRCVDAEETFAHEALKPLSLLKILGKDIPQNLSLSICLQEEEKRAAKEVLQELLHVNKITPKSFIIAFFRDARFHKKIEDKRWLALMQGLQKQNKNLLFIDILSPDVLKPLSEDVLYFEEKNLRKLGAFLSNLDAFICADTGPMHLASAAGAPTIALFEETNPSLYGTLGKKDLSYVIDGVKMDQLAEDIYHHIQNQAIIV